MHFREISYKDVSSCTLPLAGTWSSAAKETFIKDDVGVSDTLFSLFSNSFKLFTLQNLPSYRIPTAHDLLPESFLPVLVQEDTRHPPVMVLRREKFLLAVNKGWMRNSAGKLVSSTAEFSVEHFMINRLLL